MKVIKFAIALSLALGLLTFGFVTKASADTAEQNQHLTQNLELTCDTSTYGQSNCHVLGTQTGDQFQKIFLRAGVPPHKVVDTGLDTAMAAGSILTVGAGVIAVALKARLKA